MFKNIIKYFHTTQIPQIDPLHVNFSKEAYIDYTELYTFKNKKELSLAICLGRNNGIAYPELRADISVFRLRTNMTDKEIMGIIEDSEPMKNTLLSTYIAGELARNMRIILDARDNGFEVFSYVIQREKTKGTFPYDFIVERERRYKASIIMDLAEIIIKGHTRFIAVMYYDFCLPTVNRIGLTRLGVT